MLSIHPLRSPPTLSLSLMVRLFFVFQVDVFSFGIVLWELLTGEEPYADLHYGAIIGNVPPILLFGLFHSLQVVSGSWISRVIYEREKNEESNF